MVVIGILAPIRGISSALVLHRGDRIVHTSSTYEPPRALTHDSKYTAPFDRIKTRTVWSSRHQSRSVYARGDRLRVHIYTKCLPSVGVAKDLKEKKD